MATKRELTTDIRKRYGNMLRIKDVSDYLGINRNAAADWVRAAHLDCYKVGRWDKYLAADVAKALDAVKNVNI